MPKFKPQSLPWPSDRAVLLVHGIGDASGSGSAAFPLAQLTSALGAEAAGVAVYTLNYDFINDWTARKLPLSDQIGAIGMAVAKQYASPELEGTLTEYLGDILWPVIHPDTRLAIRDAYVSQLQQIVLDCGEAALPRGHDPLDYRVSIITHSLGCFHTYEVLHAAVREPSYRLRPGSDLTQLDTVIMMASPVQLIRAVGDGIRKLVPDSAELATLSKTGLALPAEQLGRKRVLATRRFVSVTGTQDPVGGHFLGKKNPRLYMNIEGQETVLVPQVLTDGDPKQALAAALAPGGGAGGATIIDPHSWSAYIDREASLLSGVFA